MHRPLSALTVLLGAMALAAPATAQTGGPIPAIQVQLTQSVSPSDVDRQVHFYQAGGEIGGHVVYDQSAALITFYPYAPLDTTAAVTWRFSAAVDGALTPFGPIYTPDVLAPACDYTVDTDADGLPDCGELPGRMYWGEWLHAHGALVGVKDMFVRIGYMLPQDAQHPRPWTRPFPEALQKVTDAFAEGGIAVHFDVGDLYETPGYDGYQPGYEGVFDISGKNHGFAYSSSVGWAAPAVECDPGYVCSSPQYGTNGWPSSMTSTSFYTTYRDELVSPYSRVFYFVLFAHASQGGASGKALRGGANAVISPSGGSDTNLTIDPAPDWTVADYWRPRTTGEVYNKIVNYQAGTLMHEMGHMLGLREGGGDDIEGKPNYFSTMSYVYQTVGLPHDHAGFVARFHNYNHSYEAGPCPAVPGTAIPHGPLGDPADFWIGFSSDAPPALTLDESQLDEGAPFFGGASVDWNCANGVEGVVQADISGNTLVDPGVEGVCWSGTTGDLDDEVLETHDDWAAVELYHVKFFGTDIPNHGLQWACPLP